MEDDITLNPKFNTSVSMAFTLTGEEQIKKLTKDLNTANETIELIKSSLEDARQELENFKSGKGIDILQEKLERLSGAATQSVKDFRTFLESVNLNDAWGTNDYQFEDLFKSIKDGSLTASQAIMQVKTNFRELMEESYQSSNGLFDSQTVQQFTASLNALSEAVGEVRSRLDSIEENGVKAIGGSGGGGSNVADVMAEIENAAKNMSDEVKESYQRITTLVQALNEYANLDSEKIRSVSQAFGQIADIGAGNLDTEAGSSWYQQFRERIDALYNGVQSKPLQIPVTANTSEAENSLRTLQEQILSINQSTITIQASDELNKSFQDSLQAITNCTLKIESLGKSLERIGNTTGVSSVTESADQATQVVENLKAELQSLANAIGSFQGVNFNLSIGGSNPVTKNTAYGKTARQTIKELKSQATELENMFKERYTIADGQSAVMKAITSMNATRETGILSVMSTINDSNASLTDQMDAWKEYIGIIQKVASAKDIDLSSVTSSFTKTADDMVTNTQKILTGEAELGEGTEKLKSIFGSTIDAEQLNTQLTTISGAIDKVADAVNRIHDGSLAELTQTINNAVEAIGKLVEAASQLGNTKVQLDGSSMQTMQQQIAETAESLRSLGTNDAGDAVSDTAEQAAKAADDRVSAEQKVIDTLQQRSSADKTAADSSAQAGENLDELTRITREYVGKSTEASSVTSTYRNALNGTETTIRDVADENGELQTSITSVTTSYKTSAQAAQEAAKAELDQATAGKQVAQVTSQIEAVQRALTNAGLGNDTLYTDLDGYKGRLTDLLNTFRESGDVSAFKAGLASLNEEYIKTKSSVDALTNSEQRRKASEDGMASATKQYYTVVTQLESAVRNYTAAAHSKNSTSRAAYEVIKNEAEQMRGYESAVKNGTMSEEELKRACSSASVTLKENTATLRANGDATKSLVDKWGTLTQKFSSWLTVSQAVMLAVRAVKQMISATVEIDSAMTQLKIVTGATDAEMTQFLSKAVDLAKELGQSVTDIAGSIETFSRLGYDLTDASELAKYASILANVADTDSDTATTGLTSIIKGYSMDVSEAEHVADVLVEVGQKYAVSASEMMEAYEKSGAALSATNTSFEKSAGLIAAANASVKLCRAA